MTWLATQVSRLEILKKPEAATDKLIFPTAKKLKLKKKKVKEIEDKEICSNSMTSWNRQAFENFIHLSTCIIKDIPPSECVDLEQIIDIMSGLATYLLIKTDKFLFSCKQPIVLVVIYWYVYQAYSKRLIRLWSKIQTYHYHRFGYDATAIG